MLDIVDLAYTQAREQVTVLGAESPAHINVPLSTLLSLPTEDSQQPAASVFRIIHYYNRDNDSTVEKLEDEGVVFAEHTDIGLLTVMPLFGSSVPGLEIWQQDIQAWFPVESFCARHARASPMNKEEKQEGGEAAVDKEGLEEDIVLLVFCGETLRHATYNYFTPAKHRVRLPSCYEPLVPMTVSAVDMKMHQFGRISAQIFLRADPGAKVNTTDGQATYSIADWEREYDGVVS